MVADKRWHRKESATILPVASVRQRCGSFATASQPFVGFAISMLKNSCASKTTRVLCAAFALAAHCDTRISHETELRQRDPPCTVAHQPRRGCARMHEGQRSPPRRTQPVHAHLNHGRTPWEIGHPDLPRQRERPRVASPGGVLFPAFAKEAHAAQEFGKTSQRKISFALKHPGAAMLRARGRGAVATGACAPRGDASTRAARGWVCDIQGAMRLQGLPVGDSRQYGTSIEHVTAVRLAMPSGARGLAVAYAEAWEKVFREDGSSEVEQRQAVGHRFESGSSTTG